MIAGFDFKKHHFRMAAPGVAEHRVEQPPAETAAPGLRSYPDDKNLRLAGDCAGEDHAATRIEVTERHWIFEQGTDTFRRPGFFWKARGMDRGKRSSVRAIDRDEVVRAHNSSKGRTPVAGTRASGGSI